MSRAYIETTVERVRGRILHPAKDTLAVEEPLEIQLGYGPADARTTKSILVTMRTPGYDFELAAGFLMTEGVIRDAADIVQLGYTHEGNQETDRIKRVERTVLPCQTGRNIVRVELASDVTVALANLERNFYTTSSCGICGKASLLALQTVCPPRVRNTFFISANTLYGLPACLRKAQTIFGKTGGLHGAGLFNSEGELVLVHEDVGRHNAVDKLLGAEFLLDHTPLRDSVLLLSGRASFELLQKAMMGGVSMVASVGAPSSLAVRVAKNFDIALIGFLREDYFNIYHGAEHIIRRHSDVNEEIYEAED